MPRTESRTKTSIWSNPEFLALTGHAQRLYWLMFSQPTISLCGVVALTVTRWANTASDETAERVNSSLDELEVASFIVMDRKTEEIFVRSFMRNDGVSRSPKTYSAAKGHAAAVVSEGIRTAVEAEFRKIDTLADTLSTTSGNTVSDTPTDRVSDTVSDTLCHSLNGAKSDNGQVDTLSDRVADTPRTRAHADSVSSLRLQSPTPSPVSAADDQNGTGSSAGTGTGTETDQASRLTAVCAGRNRQRVHLEAIGVIGWARQYVDKRIIDEAIGYAAQLDERPALPRAVASIIQSKATDSGIRMPPFQSIKSLPA